MVAGNQYTSINELHNGASLWACHTLREKEICAYTNNLGGTAVILSSLAFARDFFIVIKKEKYYV